jgi:VWFA-related protein
MRIVGLPLIAAALAFAPQPAAPQSAAPQSAAQQPTFKSSAALVEVDIIARDKDGRFVSGLTADDFEVLEDGKPQPIQHFYLVTERAAVTIEPRSDVMLPRSPDRTDRRVFVLFFDSDHLSSGSLLRLKQSAIDFVNDELRPGDMAGIFVDGRLLRGHLSNQKQELLDAIRSAEPSSENIEARTRTLLEFPRIESYQEAAQIDGGDRQALADAGVRVCGGDEARLCVADGGREFVEDKLQRKARLFVDGSRRAAATTLQSLGYVVRNLSGLEGRKTLVLLSEGFYVDDARSQLPLVAGQASRAGVTIYAVDARGSSTPSGSAPAIDPSVAGAGLSRVGDTTEEGLDILAADTGGMALRRRSDLRGVLGEVAADTSTYYVLAYSPANSTLDNKYRRITLRSKWEGLTIRARRGYVASPLPPAKTLRTK